MIELTDPRAIEEKSMAIIIDLLPELATRPVGEREIIKRIIHTTGDIAFVNMVYFHPESVESGLKAIRAGKDIVTDINMLRAGINSGKLAQYGIIVKCYINDPDVAEEASRNGLTRAMVAMRKAAREARDGIIAIGNAPTALFALCELIDKGEASPGLVVGTPVGFVGAKESKEALMNVRVPFITVPGTRGGSAIAVAAVNALLKLA